LELALDRRFGGLIAQFVEPAEGSDHEAVDQWFDETLPEWLPGSSVANVSSWALHAGGVRDDVPVPIPGDPRAANRKLQLYFVDGDPLASWDQQRQLVSALEQSGVGRAVITMPFIPTVIGTDQYIDELW
jgi:hypothetical protein